MVLHRLGAFQALRQAVQGNVCKLLGFKFVQVAAIRAATRYQRLRIDTVEQTEQLYRQPAVLSHCFLHRRFRMEIQIDVWGYGA